MKKKAEYLNLKNGFKVDLSSLSETEIKFYEKALEMFSKNVDWLAFDEFAFGMHSPIYSGRRSHIEVIKTPLYQVLRDMSLQLGVQQGKIARNGVVGKKSKEKSIA